jgi:O-methyltransferase
MKEFVVKLRTPPETVLTPHRLATLVMAASAAPNGPVVEVGVYKGGSAYALAEVARCRRPACALHLFDTFTGIPLQGHDDERKIGDFDDAVLAEVKKCIPDAVFHVGIFPQTLPDDLRDIGFVHVDCDQYETYRACIDLLFPRMLTGGIMVFDDYPWLTGAKRAVDESFEHICVVGQTFMAVKAD